MKKIIFLFLFIFITSLNIYANSVFKGKKGWNLKGFYFSISTDFFKQINSSKETVKSLWKWNGSSNNWLIFSPNKDLMQLLIKYGINTFDEIKAGEGFWINLGDKTEKIIFDNDTYYKGVPDTKDFLLKKKGWQLLCSKKSITSFPVNIFDNSGVKTIWKWNAEKNCWSVWSPDKNIFNILNQYSIDIIDNLAGDDGFWINTDAENDFKIKIENNDQNSFITPFCQEVNRPRLWLTEERLNVIKWHKENNTEKWQNFKNLCDSLIDNDPSNDPYGMDISDISNYTPQAFTAPLSLMYYLTGKSEYAEKAIELMEKTSADFSNYGDPDHKGYENLALAYDWLSNYKGMTDKIKSDFINIMQKISDKFWYEYNLTASGTDSDQNLLTGALHLMFGIALYGDYDNATTLLNRGWYGWNKGFNNGISNREIINQGLGGIYFTGMEYLPSTDIRGIMEYEMSFSTGCNYNNSELMSFWGNLIQGIISLTSPKKDIIEDYGSWQDPNTLNTQPWLYRALTIATYFAYINNDYRAKYGKGYLKTVNTGYMNDPFLELFYDVPEQYIIPESPYNNSSELPLAYFAKNPDFILYRDNWTESSGWVIFRGDGSVPLDQQSPDHGHFSIWRNGEYLTKGARNYESLAHGDFFNTLSIENNCSVNGVSCSGTAIFNSESPAKIERINISEKPLFVYAMLNADGQWNDNSDSYSPDLNVITYRRHFFHAGEYSIIFDRVRLKSPRKITYRLRSLTEPVISGNTVSQLSESGKNRLLQKTLIPEKVNIIKINEKQLWSSVEEWIVDYSQRKWQTVINFEAQKSVNILNVIQTGDSNLKNLDYLETIKNEENNGVRIGKWVIIFNSKEKLRNNVHYVIHNISHNLKHLICDLMEGKYNVIVNGINMGSFVVTKNNNTIFFETFTSSEIMEVEIKLF